MAISLESIQQGGGDKPPIMLVHGVGGVGKTTLGAATPAPIIVRTEDGLGSLDVPAFPLATTFAEVMEAIGVLAGGSHEFETVVIDSVDWLEQLIWRQVATDSGNSNIEAIGYGKGYVLALDYWREYLAALTYLRDNCKMGVFQIAHTLIKRFDAPDTESYDRYLVKLHDKASALVTEHADIVLFANYRVHVTETKDGMQKRKRAVGSGDRIVFATERPGWVAKNRYSMPDQIEMDWSAISQHIPYYKDAE